MIGKLTERIDALENPSVVGLDPTQTMIPETVLLKMYGEYGKTPEAVSKAFVAFNRAVIDGIVDIVPAVKPQIAMYERFGLHGIAAYLETIEYAHEKGLLVIGDVKRGDISSTAEAYAAHIGGVDIGGVHFDPWQEDAVTLNPYMGSDGILPFIEAAKAQDRAVFILIKTSNPSSAEVQDLLIAEESEDVLGAFAPRLGLLRRLTHDRPSVYEAVANLVGAWGEDSIGACGYSRVGGVVGATHPEQGTQLRAMLPHTFFLVPGYGAQGAAAGDLKGFFDEDGRGCIINSSRGIIAAWKNEYDDPGRADLGTVESSARAAALEMKEALRIIR
ncbi:MAG: orotidine-5'-phosphate decarboxylase [Clostridiales Family XIII bacterium]|jgi:orotidine-5'-phosphate decarboxylase|nr:orotidine-5'-phosphate decarboxylase [Clostridiales Family XIII bacterium]